MGAEISFLSVAAALALIGMIRPLRDLLALIKPDFRRRLLGSCMFAALALYHGAVQSGAFEDHHLMSENNFDTMDWRKIYRTAAKQMIVDAPLREFVIDARVSHICLLGPYASQTVFEARFPDLESSSWMRNGENDFSLFYFDRGGHVFDFDMGPTIFTGFLSRRLDFGPNRENGLANVRCMPLGSARISASKAQTRVNVLIREAQ